MLTTSAMAPMLQKHGRRATAPNTMASAPARHPGAPGVETRTRCRLIFMRVPDENPWYRRSSRDKSSKTLVQAVLSQMPHSTLILPSVTTFFHSAMSFLISAAPSAVARTTQTPNSRTRASSRAMRRSISARSWSLRAGPGARTRSQAIAPRFISTYLRTANPRPGCSS